MLGSTKLKCVWLCMSERVFLYLMRMLINFPILFVMVCYVVYFEYIGAGYFDKKNIVVIFSIE